MKLLYLSAENLKSTPFIKDLVWNFKEVGKCIILHDHFGSIADTRFVTKRISALMSEEMITNNAFSGDQRSIFQQVNGSTEIRKEFLAQALETVDLLVLNALGTDGDAMSPLDPLEVAMQLRAAFDLDHIHVFPRNSRSPMVVSARSLKSIADLEPLRAVYEEEAPTLSIAEKLLPVVLAAPSNFLKAFAEPS
ncbi:MAG: hypothetical protein RLZZ519_1151 [Bacteroidota bacterium]|jgi:hypothetical protein